MNNKISLLLFIVVMAISTVTGTAEENSSKDNEQVIVEDSRKVTIQVILGSTRKGRMSERVAKAVQRIAENKPNVELEIIDLLEFNLPFFDEGIPPALREVITDPCIQAWSEKISAADAFIMVVPSYNGGYPGVLKNALDCLYKEWNNKPVCLVGYSENPGGGNSAINQLHLVTKALKMVPVRYAVKIPNVSKILDQCGNCTDNEIEQKIDKCIDQTVMYVLHPELIPLTPCQERKKKENGGQGQVSCS